MKKIIVGIIGLLLVVGATSGAAYAIFTSKSTVNNIAFTTGNADLQFNPSDSDDQPGAGWTNTYDVGPWLAEGVYPGFNDHISFWVKNNSTSKIKMMYPAASCEVSKHCYSSPSNIMS